MMESILAIGVMTGNSLDGADAVLTEFTADGNILDLISHFKASPFELSTRLRELRRLVNLSRGDVAIAEKQMGAAEFERLSQDYVAFVADSITELLTKARADAKLKSTYDLNAIDIVGFHGQTCAHLPPSIAQSDRKEDVYTVQLGNGQALADALGITVAYDFRSDDLMQGGEAAPLAPMHHRHLAVNLKKKGISPVAFLNGGNSGNISLVSEDNSGKEVFLGWDSGPCNAFPDQLMQAERGVECDTDGLIGGKGRVQRDLLELLFKQSVITRNGDNFLIMPPPKSSDPEWYKLPSQLLGKEGAQHSFEDRLRTVEYFAAYCIFFSLSLLPETISVPSHFLLCGGAWRNPVIKAHLALLMAGSFADHPVLAEHEQPFANLAARIAARGKSYCEVSDSFGISAASMEARVFADAAVCRLKARPFSLPEQTGVRAPCVLGQLRYPGGALDRAGGKVQSVLSETAFSAPSGAKSVNAHWGRATAGWGSR